MKSKLLQEQIKTTFGSSDFAKEFLDICTELKNENSLKKFIPQINKLGFLSNFISLVDSTYQRFEQSIHSKASHSLSSINKIATGNQFQKNSSSLISIELLTFLNSMDDGFLILNRDGARIELASSVAIKILGKDPTGELLSSNINLPPESKESFQEWLNMVFLEAIPFNDLARLAPKGFQFGNVEKIIEIKFKPIRSENGTLNKIAMILYDNSSIFEAEKIIGEQKLFSEMVVKYLNNKQSFIKLIQSTKETADSLNSWSFSDSNEVQEQTKVLTERLSILKTELINLSMYSLGYKIHQIQDELSTFFQVNSNPKEGENLLHLLGQEVSDSLNNFLNKYRHVFIFDNKVYQTKEIPVESIYRFCAELMRMGLTDLLEYYIDEIVAVPFSSLFAPIEARIYAQTLSQDTNIEFNLSDPKKIRVIPEFYSLFFEQLNPLLNGILNKNVSIDKASFKINIEIDLSGVEKNKKLDVTISFSKNSISETASLLINSEDPLFENFKHSISHVGGVLEVFPFNKFSGKFIVQLPYVGEINSDVMNWITKTGTELNTSLRTVG